MVMAVDGADSGGRLIDGRGTRGQSSRLRVPLNSESKLVAEEIRLGYGWELGMYRERKATTRCGNVVLSPPLYEDLSVYLLRALHFERRKQWGRCQRQRYRTIGHR